MDAALSLFQDAENDGQGAFLGVTRSVKEQIWRERLTGDQARLATAICQQHDLPDLLGRILSRARCDA